MIAHQFVKDTRQFKGLILVAAVVLVIDLLLNLGIPGSPLSQPETHTTVFFQLLGSALLGCVVMILLMIAAFSSLSDSPARPEGYLATRPLHPRDWLAGKVLFVVVWVGLPPVAQEFLHLLLCGFTPGVAFHAGLERALYWLPIGLAAMGLGSLSLTTREVVAFFAGSVFVLWLSGVAIVLLFQKLSESGLPPEFADLGMGTRLLVFLWTVGVALLVMGAVSLRRHWSCGRRFAGAVSAGLAGLALAFACGWDLFALQPPLTARQIEKPTAAQIQIPARSLQLSRFHDNTLEGRTRFTASCRVQAEPMPAGCVLDWRVREAALRHAGGESVSRFEGRPSLSVFSWSSGYRLDDLSAMASQLPADLVLGVRNSVSLQPAPRFGLGSFRVPDSLAGQPCSLSLVAEGLLFRWEKVAELNLAEGASTRDESGEWILVSFHDLQGPFNVRLARRQVSLRTSRNQSTRAGQSRLTEEYDFLLEVPARQKVLLQSHRAFGSPRSARLTAYPGSVFHLNFSGEEHQPQPGILPRLNDGVVDPPKLLVFRKIYLGKVEKTWESPAFLPDEVLRTGAVSQVPSGPGISRAEFFRRCQTLKVPRAEGSTRAEVGRYVAECLSLMATAYNPNDAIEVLKDPMARLVAGHLPLFIDLLETQQSYGKWLLMQVLQCGVTEVQKPEIIAALRRNPDLAEILLARGWVEEARAELLGLLNGPRQLPRSCWRALAWLEEPETYPLLLQELELNPSVSLYELFRTLPGLSEALDATVNRISQRMTHAGWGRTGARIVGDDWVLRLYPGLETCVRHGNIEAFQTAFELFLGRPPNQRHQATQLLQFLRNNIALPVLAGYGYWNDERLARWLEERKAADFNFDPVRRRFVARR